MSSAAVGGPLRSFHPTGSSDDPAAAVTLSERREAIGDLGAALRTLVEASVATEAPVGALRRVTAAVRAVTGALTGRRRDRDHLPSADDLLGGVRLYNPVCGAGSALAPPLQIHLADGVAVGTCTLGLAFEGPPRFAHGGVSALLMDQVLGYAVSAGGHTGMTVELVTRYRAPVPLQTPLRLTARVTGVQGRTITAHGSITTVAAPDTTLVEATGVFVQLTSQQVRQLFHHVLAPADGRDRPAARTGPDAQDGAG